MPQRVGLLKGSHLLVVLRILLAFNVCQVKGKLVVETCSLSLCVCVLQVCAIVGGTFTVAGIIDSFVFTAHQVWKKMELGKQS